MDSINELVGRCQRHERQAFDRLFDHIENRLYDLACAILRDDEEAKDALQDCFVRIYERISLFRGTSSFETWSTAVMVNVCRDRLRRLKLRQMLSLDRLAGRRIASTVNTARAVEQRLTSNALWATLDQLEDRYRLPLLLYYRYEMAGEEIAQVLQLSTRTVYNRLSEGRKLLLNHMGKDKTNDWHDLAAERAITDG